MGKLRESTGRDGEHDPYPATDLYKEFITRHGYRHAEDIRFGAYVVLNTSWGGLSTPRGVWRDSGLFPEAQRRLTPDQFAELLIAELKSFASVEQQWDFATNDHFRDELLKALDRGGAYEKNTAKAIRMIYGRK